MTEEDNFRRAAVDALRYLRALPPGSPLPEIEFYDEEVTFAWSRAGLTAARACFDGDGEAGCIVFNGQWWRAAEGSDAIEDAPHAGLVDLLKDLPR